jgi:hypothetical protein
LLDILLLALQIVTLVLLFLFIWWVVRSARRDLVRGAGAPRDEQSVPWDGGGWSPAGPPAQTPAAPFSAAPGTSDWAKQTPATGSRSMGAAAVPAPPSAADHALARPAGAAAYARAAGAETAPDLSAATPGPPMGAPAGQPVRPAAQADGRATGSAAARVGSGGPRLVVEKSSLLAAGREIPLEGWLRIGRSPASDLTLNDSFVSSTHASVVRRGQECFVEDMGSTNGTFVNERQVAEARLTPGVRLRIGETVFRYEE